MSLKRRNVIALILILAAAICWALGQQMLNNQQNNDLPATTAPAEYWKATQETIHLTTQATMPTDERYVNTVPSEKMTTPVGSGYVSTVPATADTYTYSEKTDHRAERMLGFFLSFAAVVSTISAVFVLGQKNPILGPDGIGMALALLATIYHITLYADYVLWNRTLNALHMIARIISIFALLLSIRELYGWVRAKFTLSWCMAHRFAMQYTAPQKSLLVFVGWIVLSLTGVVYFIAANAHYEGTLFGILGYATATAFGLRCLWKYGTDLNHLKKQLDNYQQGLPIAVSTGAFAQTEAQLLQVQAQHEEAVRTAVTSERFKVELISNVSHDLRTPLTSILGYSELLQQETLSADGQEQLRLLHQKAGYMNDLVESLFELTKVSSGVVESKKDQIDLVRLMEQTIGLFDDQLVSAGLIVKRSYCADTIPAITDGARMHQVFANLLGNAIKYAMAGTRIYLEVKETDRSFLVRMMNTASYEMDFKPDEIMQRFARGDKARSTKGSGLGLAIAQTYTESVGGIFRVGVDGDQFSAIVELPKNERNL